MTYSRKFAAALAATVCVVAIATPAYAQVRAYNISGGSLKSALDAYARQSGRQVIYKVDEVRGARSKGARGTMSADSALDKLLAGSGFVARKDASGAIAIVRGQAATSGETQAGSAAADHASAEDVVEGEAITVTGSRIRGAPSSSPVIVLTGDNIRDSGQANLGEALRSLPQNFSGGQNPGIRGGAGVNEDSSSQVNLRGLGPNATLTLLNGRRLAYSGSQQGIDISAIPLVAVDRVEVIADGASALYGSDAVAGVVNVILRRNYNGASLTGLLGFSTNGGNVQNQVTGAVGQDWGSGSFMVTGDYSRSSIVRAGQRPYTAAMNPAATLYPYLKSSNALLSAVQDIGPDVTFSVHALYNDRSSTLENPSALTGSYLQAGGIQHRGAISYEISPNIDIRLPGRWRASVSGAYGRDRSLIDATNYSAGAPTSTVQGIFRNTTVVAEINAEGPVFALPGGDARLALGGGYRSVGLESVSYSNGVRSVTSFDDTRGSYYGFGEVSLPFVRPDQSIPGVYKLTASAAVRYEHYSDFGSIATPKFGVVYAPVRGLTLSGTWGKSFKTPTLTQLFGQTTLAQYSASAVGAVGKPPSSTALMLVGSNPNLVPERTTNWVVSGAFEPVAVPGLRFEASYFNIDYQNRIVAPIAVTASALSNPIYTPFVINSPTIDQINDTRALAPVFSIVSGGAYNPSNVVAIIDGRSRNVARQWVSGVDLGVSYRTAALNGTLSGSVSATYLRLRQRLVAGNPLVQLSGTIFNPPQWKGRAGLGWSNDAVSLNSSVNYIGPLDDTRSIALGDLDPQVTFDLSATFRWRSLPMANGVDFQVAVLNVFDARPPQIAVTSFVNPPFDSANYSALGRIVRLSITTSW